MDWDDYAPGLAAAYAKLGKVDPVSVLFDSPDALSADQRRQIIGQADFALHNVYAHLPLKRARHALDPFRALELLSHRVDRMTDQEFHSEIMTVFKALGDIHTSYRPPPPYDRMIAFLPFLVERYFQGGEPRYLVTRTLDGFEHEEFTPGAEVTHWSGVPIEQAIVAGGEATAGSNVGTELALAVHFLTIRWLGFSLPPREQWVMIGYAEGSSHHEIRLPWALLTLDPNHPDFQIGEQAVWALTHPDEVALSSGINAHAHVEHMARRRLFAADKVAAVSQQQQANARALKRLTTKGDASDSPGQVQDVGPIDSLIPEILEAAVLERGSARYGYIRIRAFTHAADEFVAEFRRLVDLMPEAGLIIDIRGNPGGIIQSAERLLQLFTPEEVAPLGFQFIGTPVTRALTNPPQGVSDEIREMRDPLQELWGASIDLALETGATYSMSAPLTGSDTANALGQRYYGPVVLITDSMTYSAGDMFAAGFQDLGIGPVLGIDLSTGAGGANVWSHAQLAGLLPDVPELQPLEGGAQITYAIRRCLRGGPFAGLPIEELGVRSDPPRHLMTRRDVMQGNEDLLDAATTMLEQLPLREFTVTIDREGGSLNVSLTSAGIDRLDLYVNERPWSSVDVSPGEPVSVTIEVDPATANTITARGLCEDSLVAVSRHPIS